jgi:hypothetical protein
VWVESEEGVGSTFYFSITAQAGKPYAPSAPPSHLHFLVVDESSSGSEALARILYQQSGCATASAQELENAMECTTREKFDAVFVTRTFHAQHPEFAAELRYTPLYLTGTPDSSEYHSSSIPAGTQGESQFRLFLPKPYRTDAVRAIIHSLRGKGLSVVVSKSSPSSSPLTSPVISPGIAPLRILVAEVISSLLLPNYAVLIRKITGQQCKQESCCTHTRATGVS